MKAVRACITIAGVVFPTRTHRAGLLGIAAVLLLLASPGGPHSAQTSQPATTFASTIAALSEPGGYFDTDNLISNERSYLQVLGDLRRAGIRGGAYAGVGPDQNFSYIAEIRPSIAFIIDVRRDNLLLHLLFKALFELSQTRVEYLAHLIGRRVPPAINGWRTAPIDRLVAHFDRAAPEPAPALSALRRQIDDAIQRTAVPISAEELATIHRFHQRFIDDGLALRFNTAGRPPQYYYPTYKDLLLETDSEGRQGNFLASEDTFLFVKSLQARDLVIPVVGDIAGQKAMSAIARALGSRGERLSAFYASNVEQYLYGHGTFARFIVNIRQMPRSPNSVVIRSVFRYTGLARPGDGSVSQAHAIGDLIAGYDAGRFRSYGQLVVR